MSCVRAWNSVLRRRDDDLYDRAKTLHEQVAGGLSILGSVGKKPGNTGVNLAETRRI
jgi:hypothetical protein